MIKQFIPIENDLIIEKVSSLKQKGVILFSNYYGAKDNCHYEILEGQYTIVLRCKEYDYYRIYLVTTDNDDLIQTLSCCEDSEYVINIPSKGSINQWDEILRKVGFTQIAEYRRYYNNKKIVYRKSAIGEFARHDENSQIRNILNEIFSKYTDTIPSEKELRRLIDNKQVLVSHEENGNVCGVLIFCFEGKKCYFRIWVDKGNTGLFLLYKAYNIVVEQNINYVYFWVNSTNKDVIRLHTLMGAQSDGLSDYTYIKTK